MPFNWTLMYIQSFCLFDTFPKICIFKHFFENKHITKFLTILQSFNCNLFPDGILYFLLTGHSYNNFAYLLKHLTLISNSFTHSSHAQSRYTCLPTMHFFSFIFLCVRLSSAGVLNHFSLQATKGRR